MNYLNKKKSDQIEFSYYEIYNEKIYDLLNSSSRPSSKQNKINQLVIGNANGASNSCSIDIRENTGPFIEGLKTISVDTAASAKMWLDIGNKQRATAYTNNNKIHLVLIL